MTELNDGLNIRSEENRKTKDASELEYPSGLWAPFPEA